MTFPAWSKTVLDIKLLIRAPGTVISRKGYGFRKASLVGSFMVFILKLTIDDEGRGSFFGTQDDPQ
jgi:hypothetical protein